MHQAIAKDDSNVYLFDENRVELEGLPEVKSKLNPLAKSNDFFKKNQVGSDKLHFGMAEEIDHTVNLSKLTPSFHLYCAAYAHLLENASTPNTFIFTGHHNFNLVLSFSETHIATLDWNSQHLQAGLQS